MRQDSLELFACEMEAFSESGHLTVDGFPSTLPTLTSPPMQDWDLIRNAPHAFVNINEDADCPEGRYSNFAGSHLLKTVRAVGWKQHSANSLNESEVKKIKVTRWRKEKSRIGCLEQHQQEKKALVDAAMIENKRLKIRAWTMEHILAARERQLSILKQYHRLCGPGSTDANSQEAKEFREAATATLPLLVNLS
jgi:hypothetical protein